MADQNVEIAQGQEKRGPLIIANINEIRHVKSSQVSDMNHGVRQRRRRLTDGHDAQTPNVNFRAVLFACDDLGCHPVRCADHRRALRVCRVRNLSAEPKIG